MRNKLIKWIYTNNLRILTSLQMNCSFIKKENIRMEKELNQKQIDAFSEKIENIDELS